MGRYASVHQPHLQDPSLNSLVRIIADADRKLLLAIISAQSVKVDSPAVASILSVGEVTCTPRAVEERIKKLKKIAREQGYVGCVCILVLQSSYPPASSGTSALRSHFEDQCLEQHHD